MSERYSSTGPATAREAAIKILLGDVAPLFQRVHELQDQFTQLQGTQQAIHAELAADMQQLGAMMAKLSEDARKIQNSGADAARTLQRFEHLAERMEAGAPARVSQTMTTPLRRPDGGAPVWLVAVLAALLCAALLGAGILFWQQKQNSNALAAGLATLKAWPELGDRARRTIEAAARR